MTQDPSASSHPSGTPPPGNDPGVSDLNRARVEIWNRSVFIELCDVVGVASADHIVGLFRADLSTRFINPGSRDALRRDAHVVKSTAGMLGFDELSDLAATLEADCAGDEDVTRSLVALMGARRRAEEALSKEGPFSASPVESGG